MTPGKILNKEEELRLVELIRKMEMRTTGEIRIHIAKRINNSRHVIDNAAFFFKKLGMDQTRERNGVLLYIAVKNRTMACIGDKGIHEKAGEEAWQKIIGRLKEAFAKGDYFIGLSNAVEDVGTLLSKHYPLRDGQPANALPDEVSYSR